MTLSRRKFVQLSSLAPLSYFLSAPQILQAMEKKPGSALSLFQSFQNPSGAARPFVRWWWNGGRITEKEVVRELDLLKKQGISGVEINTIAFPSDNQAMGHEALNWLGEGWLDVLQKTLKAAKERDITCDIIVGSGWPFGGEFLEKREQIKIMALGTRKLSGGNQFQIKKSDLINELSFLKTYDGGSIELFEARLSPAKLETFQPGTKIDIGQEDIVVDVPAGDHILLYLVKATGYAAVTHGAPGASGPVIDHYNKAAVQRFLDRMSDAITAKIGVMGDHFRSVFIDSLELRGSNWAEDLLTEFKKRRGYDVLPYLPYMLFKLNKESAYNGNHVEGAEDVVKYSSLVQNEIERVRYDFETTRLELFDERFLQTFVDWCKKNKVKSRVQAYGREYYTLESAMKLDIPECETWLRADVGKEMPENTFRLGRGYRPVNKFAASAALLTGKRIVSCEEITNTSMVFNDTLEHIKLTGDQSNLSGVTHSILHGFNYSPKEIPFPGWVRYGSYFNERNTWWPYLRRWIDYKARLSQVFQSSIAQANTAIMFANADLWSRVGLQYQQLPQIVQPEYANNIWEAIHQNGGGCDYITERILAKSKFSNGQLHFGPRSYGTLMMIEMESIAPETASFLKQFVDAGGKLIFVGKDPSKTFGRLNHATKDQKVSSDIKALKKNYPNRVISHPAPTGKIIDWYKDMQAKLSIPVYVKFDRPVNFVSQVHYKTAEADVFFISNNSIEHAHDFTATFNIPNKTAWVWDAETGKKYIYPTQGAKNKLNISLDAAASVLIVFTNETKGELYPVRKPANNSPVTIDGNWNVNLDHVMGESRQLNMDKLLDFKADESLQTFAGVVYYQNQFEISKPQDFHSIDLGEVHGITELELNGQPIGVKWYGQHIYDVQKSLKPGKNTIRIKLTTTLGNYARSLKDNKVAQNWIKKQPINSSGLVGPVRLI